MGLQKVQPAANQNGEIEKFMPVFIILFVMFAQAPPTAPLSANNVPIRMDLVEYEIFSGSGMLSSFGG